MQYQVFVENEIKRTDQAVALAQKALKTTVNLRDFYYQLQGPEKVSDADAYTRDTLKYFDANGAFRELELLQLQLGELKNKLIEIKTENDKMLFAGGYLTVIDETIAHIFLKNTLCKLEAKNENTSAVLEESIQELQKLKLALSDLL